MSKMTDPWRTEFGVQPFSLERKGLQARPIQSASDRDRAIRLGERLAPSAAGVVVFSRRVAPEIGEYDEPLVLATHGRVPAEVLDFRRA